MQTRTDLSDSGPQPGRSRRAIAQTSERLPASMRLRLSRRQERMLPGAPSPCGVDDGNANDAPGEPQEETSEDQGR